MTDLENELREHGRRVRERISAPVDIERLNGIKPRSRKKRTAFVLIAACIAVIGLSTVTTAFKSWDVRLAELFNSGGEVFPDTEQSYDIPMMSETVNGITVTVDQVIFDENSLYVLYEVELPDNIEVNKNYKFRSCGLDFETADDGAEEVLTVGSRNEVISYDEHSMSFLVQQTTVDPIISRDITLKLSDFGCDMIENGEYLGFDTAVEGEWSITFRSDLTGSGRTYRPEENVSFGSGAELEKLTVSPFAATVKVRGADVMGGIEIKLLMKDGGEIDCRMSDGNPSGMSSYMYTNGVNFIYYRFETLLETDDIEAVFINGIELKESKE